MHIDLLNKIEKISLHEMDGVKLLDRIDSKFIFNVTLLPELLELVSNDYKILSIDNNSIFEYHSIYFDNNELQFYFDHHRGKPNRIKIRYREYKDSGLVFFELKRKINGIRTIKNRLKTSNTNTTLNGKESEFLDKFKVSDNSLKAIIEIDYQRITLVHKNNNERVTIDLNIKFDNYSQHKQFDKLAVVEIKQNRYNRYSPIINVLRKLSIKPLSISKYALGMAITHPELKQNNFKQHIININKIQNAWSQ